MKLPQVLLVLGAAGLLVSFFAFQSRRSEASGNVQTTYYTNGQVQSQTSVVGGRREGSSTRFYADGKKLAEGAYSDGKMEGDWTFWLPSGAVDAERTGTYRAGERQGEASLANAGD